MKKRSLMERLREKKALRMGPPVGVCWYVPQEWARVKAAAADPEAFEDSFQEWETMANAAFALIRKHHPGAVKAFLSADAFLAWCQSEGKINNSTARAEFARIIVSTGGPDAA